MELRSTRSRRPSPQAASGLQYDAPTQTYTYVWKTQKAWRGTCRSFTLRLDDGTQRTVDFKFS